MLMRHMQLSCIFSALLFASQTTGIFAAEADPQYELGDVKVVAATAEEAKRDTVSLPLALDYLEKGNHVWSGQRKCVSCHTNGTYMTVRPALTAQLGKPTEDAHKFFVSSLARFEAAPIEELKKSTLPAQVIYTAAGLAEWDKYVTQKLSPETDRALSLMLAIQLETGTWGTLDCWPPYESDAYHEATVALTAVATAPGWMEGLKDEKLKTAVAKLKSYLQTEKPPHDYSRILLLRTATRVPGLITPEQQTQLVEMVSKHQREDGGWSIRTFAAPEAWGSGNRAKRLQTEPDVASPASDGHQTGLAIIALREAGIPASDPRIQKGLAWIKANQRESGRWWTKSLNTDKWHFITYSGTAFPVQALALCDELPAQK